MPFQKVEYSFPDEEKEDSIVIEDSGEVEIDLSGKKTAEEYANTPVEPEIEVEEPKAEHNASFSRASRRHHRKRITHN